MSVTPSDFGPSLDCAIVVDLHIVIVAVGVVFQVEGFKGQSDNVSWRDADEPGTVSTVGVVVGVAWAHDGPCGTGQCSTTAYTYITFIERYNNTICSSFT